MRILRLGIVGIKFRQTHITYGLPVTRQCFDITIMLSIQRMFFNTVIQVESVLQGLSVTRGTGIFRQAVDGKADSIELLLRVLGLSLVVETPIHATIFRVDEMIDEITFGTICHFQILRLAKHPIGRRESPQDTGIQDGALVSISMQHIAIIDATIKTAMLLILHTVHPEAQDVVLQHLKHLLLECLYLCHFLIG